MKLSKNFDYDEFFVSADYPILARHAKDSCDVSTPELMAYLITRDITQPTRSHFNMPVIITSAYRNERLNIAVGGAKNSNHMRFLSADITVHDKDVLFDIFNWLRNNRMEFIGELIIYLDEEKNPEFMHVSYIVPGKWRKLRSYQRLKDGTLLKATYKEEEGLNK